MKRKLIIGVLIISQILFVFGQSTTKNFTTESSTLSSLSTSESTLSPSFSTSSVQTITADPFNPDPVIYPYNTVQVPSNNGTWQICAQGNTTYVSYSIKVVSDSSPLTPDYGTTNYGQPSPIPSAPTVGVVVRVVYSDGLRFIPSLSCYSDIVTECDQDTGTISIKDSDGYCLQIINPGPLDQKVNVTVSFNSTVFKNKFTSENKPGGNSKHLTDHSDSGASVNYKSTFGALVILFVSSWLVSDCL
ncbi:10538_t:CDS:2 [Acaulospora morrowiae]|uniref:10538_t:CDS:1 n=1 Tax=Acaulospora morrowiae TaxID=94023 RepID=A0A9N8VM97_9GLOM|nr:10538_t:CDS:2 [Acaulospora morrowiae]